MGDQTSPLTIRPATLDDAAPLAALCTQLGYPVAAEDMRRRLAGLLPDGRHAVLVAARPDGRIIGWVHVLAWDLVVEEALAEVAGLVVDEDHRGRGVGRRLLQHAEQWARTHGCRAIHLRANVVRQAAHAFYRRQGYESYKTQLAFRKAL